MAEEARNYEEEARSQGWKPEDEWEGDPPKSGFKSAEQFVKDGENITPILKSKVDRLEDRVNELLNSNKQLHELSQRTIKREKAEKERLIAELESARRQAVTEGDGDAFDKADRQLNELRSDVDSKPQPSNPLADQWLEANPWYNENFKLQAFADGIAEGLVRQGFTGKAYFDELTRRTKETFPEDFGNKNRSKPNGVEGDTTPVDSNSKSHTFNDLPADAKAQYKIFARDIPGFTKEAYLEQYEWDD